MGPVFLGRVDEAGRLLLEHRNALTAHLRGLAGKRVELVVRKQRARRSNEANRYYWGVVVAVIADHLGYDRDECHEALAWHFLRAGEDGEKLPRRQSTASLDTGAFSEYVERVKRWAAEELGIYVPDANEVAA
jgi:hypothetical protein